TTAKAATTPNGTARPAGKKRKPMPLEALGRAADQEFRRRNVGPLGILGKVLDMAICTTLVAITTPEEAIRAAGGDRFEAMRGHHCGPDCYHAVGKTPEEKQAWWNKRIQDYEADLARRAHPPALVPRCPSVCDGKQCCYAEKHPPPHSDKPVQRTET